MDPDGRRLFCFMIYGSSAMTLDGGKSWMKSKVSHLDFGWVDWDDTGKRVLALRHEAGGMLTTSDDGGATWKDLEKGFNGCGVFDRKTFVATKAKGKTTEFSAATTRARRGQKFPSRIPSPRRRWFSAAPATGATDQKSL